MERSSSFGSPADSQRVHIEIHGPNDNPAGGAGRVEVNLLDPAAELPPAPALADVLQIWNNPFEFFGTLMYAAICISVISILLSIVTGSLLSFFEGCFYLVTSIIGYYYVEQHQHLQSHKESAIQMKRSALQMEEANRQLFGTLGQFNQVSTRVLTDVKDQSVRLVQEFVPVREGMVVTVEQMRTLVGQATTALETIEKKGGLHDSVKALMTLQQEQVRLQLQQAETARLLAETQGKYNALHNQLNSVSDQLQDKVSQLDGLKTAVRQLIQVSGDLSSHSSSIGGSASDIRAQITRLGQMLDGEELSTPRRLNMVDGMNKGNSKPSILTVNGQDQL